MGRFKTKLLLSFRTKILVPVMLVMVLVMTLSMWLIGHQVKRQIIDSARQQLAKDDVAFKNLDERHIRELFWRYGNIKSDPQFQSAATLIGLPPAATESTVQRFFGFGRSSKPAETTHLPNDTQRIRGATFRDMFDKMVGDGVADVISLSPADGRPITVSRDPQLNSDEFENGCAPSVEQVITSQQQRFSRQLVGDRLYDVVLLPIYRGSVLTGVITFGVASTVLQDFKKLTSSDAVLVAQRKVVASTLPNNLRQPLETLLTNGSLFASSNANAGEPDAVLGGEQFICLSGRLSRQNPLDYLILASRERPLSELRATQQNILLVSLCTILLGSTIVWLVVRKAVEPLEDLRDSAEAIGSGDFSRRVQVSSRDECGELAQVFNQMAENLQRSRGELEATVERLKTAQAQLVQSEKLSGIGEFVAGVAHELNNPLTTVMGFSELLLQTELGKETRSFLEMIFKSSQRCQKIVQSLLSFARRHQPERKPVCVSKLIEASVEILQYQLRTSNIDIQLRLDPKLPLAMVDSHQMQQVFVNIINNGRQAIEAHLPKGWIRVSTETCGSNVRIIIQDSGPGISEENLSKIFDPFFTTKEVGTGTGLGLSLCYGIIKEHGGSIVPKSRRGEGAMFVIELPITHADQPTEAVPHATTSTSNQSHKGRKVLVIDDEEPILRMVSEVLRREGYAVDVAQDGETGLRRLRESNYDVTLCDWKMPGLNGREIYERIRQTNPGYLNRVIFITGDMVSDKTRKFLETENKACLPKPFSLSDFRAAISRVIV